MAVLTKTAIAAAVTRFVQKRLLERAVHLWGLYVERRRLRELRRAERAARNQLGDTDTP